MAAFPKGKTFTQTELIAICNRDIDEEYRITRDSVRRWVEREMITPTPDSAPRNIRFSFLEVVKAKAAASLLATKKRKGTGKNLDSEIRAAVTRLGGLLARANNLIEGYSGMSVFTEGVRVVFETDRYKMEGSTGQLLFRFEKIVGDMPNEDGLGRVADNLG